MSSPFFSDVTAARERQNDDKVARAVLILAPVLAFGSLGLPGIFSLAMVVPAAYLASCYVRRLDSRLQVWNLAFIAVVASSVLWGDDPNFSAEQLRTFLPLAVATILAGGLLTAPVIRSCLNAAFAVIVGSSIVVLCVVPSSRSSGSVQAWVGQYDKNVYGGLLVLCLALVLTQSPRFKWSIVLGLVALIGLNRSVTAWVIALVLLAVAPLYRATVRRLGPGGAFPLLVVGSAIGSCLLYVIVRQTSAELFTLVDKDPSLSLRTEIWRAVWPYILERPWLGHGAYTFLDPYSNSPVTQGVWTQFTKYLPPHAHNGLLDLWGQVGLFGLAVFAGAVSAAVAGALRSARRGSGPAGTALAMLGVILAFSITEPTFMGNWFILLAVVLGLANASVRMEPLRHEALAMLRGEQRTELAGQRRG